MRNFDTDVLRALVAIADTTSFSLAAARLGRSQSAISLQIKRLEEQVGKALLMRTQGRVSGPTAEGRLLIDYARQILRLNDEVAEVLFEPSLGGRLRVGVPEELMESAFAGVLDEFSRTYPRVALSLNCDLSVQLATLLEAGELDVALLKSVDADPRAKDTLWHEPLVWMRGIAHPVPQARPLPIAVFQEGCVFRVAALERLARHDIAWRIAFTGHSYAALRHAVASGLAVSPLPLSLLSDGLEIVGEGLPRLPQARVLARFASGQPMPAARRLVEMFREHLWAGRRRARSA
ncbi:MAG: LysR family transcriptional regulator [Burkholderiales bacterium]|nr:LysR family transcriptional regulator [Burkholderiales bacterium]MDE2609612.1 LysR family transcriptional regulator [Burkholderiales bacterium]